MADGIEEFLTGANEAAPAVEAEAATAAPAAAAGAVDGGEAGASTAGQPRASDGKFAPKGEAEAGASPAPGETPPLEHPALLGERRRRQDAERQLEEMRQRSGGAAAPEAPQALPQQSETPPDRYEDPEAYDAWLIGRARSEALASVQEERIMESADAARSRYPDWQEKAAVFAQLARSNPNLEHALRTNRNPAEYAYRTASLHLELQQHGSIEALIAARVAAEVARVGTAPGTTASAAAPASATVIPESLAASQSARSSAAAPGGPPSLDDILNPPRK
jgi:hypothetical protein